MQLQDLVKGMRTTRLLYLEDSYVRTLESKVLRAEPEKKNNVYLILDETIFHPKSGGQPSDKGSISAPAFKVLVEKAMIVDDVIVHWGKIVEGKPEEAEAREEIDWPSRYLYMRRHTAGHLLDHCLKVVTGRSVETLSSWLGEPCYVGYRGEPPSMDLMTTAVKLGNELIERGADVRVETVSYDELVGVAPDAPNIYRLPLLETYRIVAIDGCTPIPCAGTHVRNISEIGRVVLNNVEKMDSQFKVYYDIQ